MREVVDSERKSKVFGLLLLYPYLFRNTTWIYSNNVFFKYKLLKKKLIELYKEVKDFNIWNFRKVIEENFNIGINDDSKMIVIK